MLAGLLAGFAASAQAIVNVDEAIIDPQQEGFQQLVHLSIDGARGNTNKNNIKGDALSQWRHGHHTEFLLFQFSYGKSNGNIDTNRVYVHARHRTQLDPRWAIEAFAQIGRDPFSRLKRRTLLGGGTRLTVLEELDVRAVYVGLGAFHEREQLNPLVGATTLHSNLWRGSSYFLLNYRINEQLRFSSITYYQPAFRDMADYRLLEQASLNIRMTEDLDLRLALDYSFDARPPQAVKSEDVSYSTGLEYRF